ncbi:MAG: hypothetical protein HYY06_20595 [Deltaproteobacteria bacterium]|nr:hypothetical protein [Deltaproteobacteria bacterium]
MPLLPLEPADRRPALLLAWLMVVISAATKLGDGVVQALFLERVGADWLGSLFVLNSILDFFAGALYLRLARGAAHGSFFRAVLATAAVATVTMRAVAATAHPAAFFAIYAVHGALSMIITLHWGIYLLDFFPQSRTARVFPVVYAGARIGGVLGGASLAALASSTGLADLLFAVALLQLAAAVFAHALSGRAPVVRSANSGKGLAGEVRAGLATARASPLLRAMAAATAMMVLVRLTLRYLSGDALSTSMGEAELAGFLGRYLVIANAAGFLLQILVMPRLIARIGVSGANVAYAALSLFAFGSMAISYGVWTAAAARLVDSELKDSMKTPLSALFYGALDPADRARGRAFILGLVIPLASVAGGVGIQAASDLAPRLVVAIGLALAVLFVLASWHQNSGYRAALRVRMAGLRSGSAEAEDLRRALEAA